MNNAQHEIWYLSRLLHYRWAVSCLGELHALGGGAKFVALQSRLGVSRDSLKRTLEALIDLDLVLKNPGYGHPMRPEYLLSRLGKQAAPTCLALMQKLNRLRINDVAFKKWSLPVTHALSQVGGRFNRLKEALQDITPRALTQTLRDLQQVNLVERRLVDDSPPRTEYRLTRRGRGLVGAVAELAQAG